MRSKPCTESLLIFHRFSFDIFCHHFFHISLSLAACWLAWRWAAICWHKLLPFIVRATVKVQTSLKTITPDGERENSINTKHFSCFPMMMMLLLLLLRCGAMCTIIIIHCWNDLLVTQDMPELALHSSTSNAQSFIESTLAVHCSSPMLYIALFYIRWNLFPTFHIIHRISTRIRPHCPRFMTKLHRMHSTRDNSQEISFYTSLKENKKKPREIRNYP